MRRWTESAGRLVGPTLEDWLLTVLMIVAIALTVGGVRSCEGHFWSPPEQAQHLR